MNKIELIKKDIIRIQKSRNKLSDAWFMACNNLNIVDDVSLIFGYFILNNKELKNKNKYHNQLHTAEAMIVASHLINYEYKNDVKAKEINGFKLIIAMMYHDINHEGRNNLYAHELEKKAILTLYKFIEDNRIIIDYYNEHLKNKYGTFHAFLQDIAKVIYNTDFNYGVKNNINSYTENSNDLQKISMLANEADIFVSCLNDLGLEKNHLLAKEINDESLKLWKSRRFFLSNLAHFKSEASNIIKIKEHIQHQINYIDTLNINDIIPIQENKKNDNFLKNF